MIDEDIWLRMLDWRGIEEGQECSRCGGAGTLAYSSTATWRGGAGGSTITTDVCATCWGSGTKRPWPNWRRIAADAETIRKQAEEIERLTGNIEDVKVTLWFCASDLAESRDQVRVLRAALEFYTPQRALAALAATEPKG